MPTIKSDNPFADISEDEEKLLHGETDVNDIERDGDETPKDKPSKEAPGKEQEPGQPTEEEAEQQEKEGEDTETDNAHFEEFKKQHGKKTADELLRIAYQNTAARTQARHETKQARQQAQTVQDTLAKLVERMNKNRDARLDAAAARTKQFDEELKLDPDAATRRLHNELLRRDIEQSDSADWDNFISEQARMTQQAIESTYGEPWAQVAPKLMQYGIENAGYTAKEMESASDFRDLVVLEKARRFDLLIASGRIQLRNGAAGRTNGNGNGATVQNDSGMEPAVNAQFRRAERAVQHTGKSLSNTSGGGSSTPKSLVRQAEEILAMNDREFGKLSDEAFEKLARQLDSGSN